MNSLDPDVRSLARTSAVISDPTRARLRTGCAPRADAVGDDVDPFEHRDVDAALDEVRRGGSPVGPAPMMRPSASPVCALTMVLGQLISNTATVLIVAPIAVVIAGDLGVSVLPFMMALGVAGAASFLTPVATPANTMVLEPGGYRFGDYWKLGLPLLLFFLVVAVFYVPLVWPF